MTAAMPLTPDARELLSLLAYVYLENNRPEKTAVVLNALRTLGLADPASSPRWRWRNCAPASPTPPCRPWISWPCRAASTRPST